MSCSWAFLFVLHILTLPCQIFLIFILFLFKKAVCLLAKCFKDFVAPIPSTNCVFISDPISNKPHSTIVCILHIDAHVSKEQVAEKAWNFAYSLKNSKDQRCFPELGYTPVHFFGYGFWKEIPNFRMEDYVHVLTNNPNVDSETFLVSIVEELQRKPFAKDSPLWDCYLLHNFKGQQNHTLMLIRYHHMLADGMSFVKFFYAIAGTSNLPLQLVKPSNLQKWNELKECSLWKKVVLFVYMATVGYVDYLNDIIFQKDRNPLLFDKNGKLKLTGNWICAMGAQHQVELLKQATKRYECSITHLLLAAVAKGVENYIIKYHTRGEANLPKQFHFLSELPVPEHSDMRFSNHWCLTKLRTKTGINSILQRLEHFQEETKLCAAANLPVASAAVFQNMCGLLPAFLANLMTKAKGTSTINFSNVVGPNDRQSLFSGAPVSSMYFWLPIVQESTGLAIGIMSCNNGIRVSYTADVGVIADRQRLQDLVILIDTEILNICRAPLFTSDYRLL